MSFLFCLLLFCSTMVFLFQHSLFMSLIYLEVMFLTSTLIISSDIGGGQFTMILFVLGIGVLSACVGLTMVVKSASQ